MKFMSVFEPQLHQWSKQSQQVNRGDYEKLCLEFPVDGVDVSPFFSLLMKVND